MSPGRRALRDVLVLLHTPVALLLLTLLVGGVLLPFLFAGSDPRPYGSGTVVRTAPGSAEAVVRLDDGTYTTAYGLEDLDSPPARVELYKAEWDAPTVQRSAADPYVIAGFFGAIILASFAFVVGFLADAVLDSLIRRVDRWGRGF